jgi:membrane-bound lytic murein transglycosylase B
MPVKRRDRCGDAPAARSSRAPVLAVALATVALAAIAPPRPAAGVEPLPSSAWDAASRRGWGYLVEKLTHDGFDRERVSLLFADERVPPFSGLRFSLRPREPRSMYRGFLTSSSVAQARSCRARYDVALEEAEAKHGVPASVVAAILHVETACGRNTGNSRILPALARLAMAAEPANLAVNIESHTGVAYPASAEDAQPTVARGRRLEEMFYPEVRGTLEIAERMGIDPLEMRGSGSGAFGMPQFLPTSYLRYGRDGNGDGRVSLYDPEDAIFSCASYLEGHGWREGLTLREKREVIWHYNHSPAYVDTVLSLATRIDAPARPVVQVAKKPGKSKAKSKSSVAKAPSKSGKSSGVSSSGKSAKAKAKPTSKPAAKKTSASAGAAKKPS